MGGRAYRDHDAPLKRVHNGVWDDGYDIDGQFEGLITIDSYKVPSDGIWKFRNRSLRIFKGETIQVEEGNFVRFIKRNHDIRKRVSSLHGDTEHDARGCW